ncbi:MAG: ATP phosphoribosyltransferase regulatory subunit, partial [Microcoleus sp. SIO2G3]|nr:ATP phosphoribosyltransferase regulatory subunit [Microcoleus sp. SIO2G3]
KAIAELLTDSGSIPNLTIDLSLMRTFDYYTGIVFEVVSSSGQRILGQGGRYDQLLGLYHPQGQSYPGVGFVLNIEELHQTLLPSGQLPSRTPAIDWLVVPKTPQAYAAAFAYAQTLRQSADLVRVEVELGERQTPDAIRQYGRDRRIRQIAWVDEAGDSAIEVL